MNLMMGSLNRKFVESNYRDVNDNRNASDRVSLFFWPIRKLRAFAAKGTHLTYCSSMTVSIQSTFLPFRVS
jgi:hypothetical protein